MANLRDTAGNVKEEGSLAQEPSKEDEQKRLETHYMSDDHKTNIEKESSISDELFINDLLQMITFGTMGDENGAIAEEPVITKESSTSQEPLKEDHEKMLDPGIMGGEDLVEEPADNSLKQLVIYNPTENYTSAFRRRCRRRRASSNVSDSSIDTFTVQCSACFKWRRVPTQKKYEEIRANISQIPFVCERVHEWQPHISCHAPTTISPDDHSLWALDTPDIAQPPRGWERLLQIRSKGGTKFADVYYISPCGMKLRSMTDVERYLNEHTQYEREGINLSQFSFRTPRPLQANYVRKRQYKRKAQPDNGVGSEFHMPPEPVAVTPGCT